MLNVIKIGKCKLWIIFVVNQKSHFKLDKIRKAIYKPRSLNSFARHNFYNDYDFPDYDNKYYIKFH